MWTEDYSPAELMPFPSLYHLLLLRSHLLVVAFLCGNFQRIFAHQTRGLGRQTVGEMVEADERQGAGFLPGSRDRRIALVSPMRALLQGMPFDQRRYISHAPLS